MRIGSCYLGDGRCEFTVWAPNRQEVAVQVTSPEERLIPLQQVERGYWRAEVKGIQPGTLYFYRLDGADDKPDPASNFQPEDVHGPSAVMEHSTFAWNDAVWSGISLDEMIIYELHVGTFTAEGTFEAAISRLDDLCDVGINAIEIMPVAQFPGDRNWGYDGVYPFAVQTSYGGPEGLKRLVDACHQKGLAVILDVVYNHFGPEGNYMSNFGPYFTETYRTPWGSAMNFDDAQSDGVRNFFIQNALYWFREYHMDALRLDAIHAIYDLGAKHFLAELSDAVADFSHQQGRKLYLIAESDLDDVRVINPQSAGGYGMDAQWSDDFHHSLHTLLTGEQDGYYEDFGECQQLAKAFKSSFVYSWQYSAHRQRFHGSDASDRPGSQFVVFAQNHDQVGNRMLGERLSQLVGFEALKLAAGALLLSPNIPLIFMGEEYGEESPFLYFVSHSDPDLVKAVREGRAREFKAFHLAGDPPDPEGKETFQKSKLKWEQRQEGKHKVLLDLYRQLIQLRHSVPAVKALNKQNLRVDCVEADKLLFLHRWSGESHVFCMMNFSEVEKNFNFKATPADSRWEKLIDSSDAQWLGANSKLPEKLVSGQTLSIQPQSFALYQKLGV